ncbi:hypothetical protein ABFX02_08G206000 [Erythranthe guttata]
MGGGAASHGGTDSSNHAGEEEVTINISCSDGAKFSVQVCLDSTVVLFKSIVARKCEIPTRQQRVIYRGRILGDDHTLRSYGLEAGHTVHLVRSSATSVPAASTEAGARNFFPGFDEGGPGGPGLISTFFPGILRDGIRNYSDIYEHVQQQFRQNPNLVSDFFNSPSVRNVMRNPEILRTMMLSSPESREIMDRNPGVTRTFSDPIAFHHTMESARYPEIVHRVYNTPAPNINPPRNGTSAGTGGMQTNLDTQSGNLVNVANSNHAQSVHHLGSTETLQQLNRSLSSRLGRQTSPEPGQNAEITAGRADNLGLDTLTNMFRGLRTPPNSSQVPPEELYATQLSQLREMGFIDKRESITALIASTGNVTAAVDRLTGNPGQ